MNIHEYQAQSLFGDFKIPVPSGIMIGIGDDYTSIIQSLHLDQMCIKAQIHANGRREGYFNNNLKYGRVKIAKSKQKIISVVKHMLGNMLVTKQTGTKGKVANKAYIADLVEFIWEYSIAIMIDRKVRRLISIISTEGRVNIEEMADKSPKKVQTIVIDPISRLQIHQIEKLYVL
jgi:succinyl-CoA synthetase beta subunit